MKNPRQAVTENLETVLDTLDDTDHEKPVTLRDILSRFEGRSYGALVTVFGLIASIPFIGGIPGMSLLTGLIIVLASVQYLAGGGRLWLPERIEKFEIAPDKLSSGIEKARPWAKFVDGFIKPRLSFYISGRFQKTLVAIVILVLGLSFLPMAFAPFAVLVPAIAVILFGLALMTRDGLLALLGYGVTAASGFVFWYSLDTIMTFLG
jgi:hypothetical protein